MTTTLPRLLVATEAPLNSASGGFVIIRQMLRPLRDLWRIERRLLPTVAIVGPLSYALICFEFQRVRNSSSQSRTDLNP